jgi:pyruvate dehydrogenase E2 component (dihydrolipoamide acetyltransferase)
MSAAYEDEVYFDNQRRVVSHTTSKSWRTVPHVSFIYEPDVTDFFEAFRRLAGEAAKSGRRLTLNTVLLKSIAEGLKKAPSLNAFVEYAYGTGAGKLVKKREINIAVPWLLTDGRMITPTIFDCGAKSLDRITDDIAQIEKKIQITDIDELLFSAIRNDTVNELKKGNLRVLRRIISTKVSRHPLKRLSGAEGDRYYRIAEADRLTKDDLLGATVLVSNVGSLYKELKGHFGMLQIIPPQVFAIGIGAVQERPGVGIDQSGAKAIGFRKYLPMTLVFDHRPSEFDALIPFIRECDEIFGNPGRMGEW